MSPKDKIDNLIKQNPDWRGVMLSSIRSIILEVDHNIIEEWKWMGSPVWSLDGILCVGNIFKNKVQIVFMNGAFLGDPDNIFNAGLTGNKRRVIDIFEGSKIQENSLKILVRSAINYNQLKTKE